MEQVIDSMLGFLAKPYNVYGKGDNAITLSSSYLNLETYSAILNKQAGKVDIIMQCTAKIDLAAGSSFIAGRLSDELAPVFSTAAAAVCPAKDTNVITVCINSATASSNPKTIVITPQESVSNGMYIYISASYPIGATGGGNS